jgi:acetylornithine deacetylase/succinyl-diaminopimelate desuccinylase-like protein
MHQVIGELLRWRAELQASHRNPLFEVEVPTLNLGHIHGGDNPNRICADCELHIDIRPLPGMSLADLARRVAWSVGSIADRERVATGVSCRCSKGSRRWKRRRRPPSCGQPRN